MTTNANTARREREPSLNPDDELTPGELAYADGGDTAGLVKEGVQIGDAPVAAPAQGDSAEAKAPSATAAEPAAAAEPHADDDDAEPEIDPKTNRPRQRGRWVAKKALDEARAEIKQLRADGAATKEQWARLEERFKVFQEAVTAPEAQEEPQEETLPDPEQDIFGYLKALAPRLDRRFADIDQRLGQVNQRNVAQDETADLMTRYTSDVNSFARENPDFMEAYRFLLGSRNAELEAAGYDDPVERIRLVNADEQALVSRALSRRSSPAQSLYALAKARGYAPKAAVGANGATAANGGGNAAANGAGNGAANTNQAAKPSAAEEIARVQRGQEASLSLSNVGGNRPQTGTTINDLLAMSDAEFKAFMRKNPDMVEQIAGR